MHDKIREYVYSKKGEIVSALRELVEIPSVKGEPEEDAPFGKEPKRALFKMMELCKNAGLSTKLCENVVGSADYSPDGEVGLGILCHLDVVPVEESAWSTPPFSLTEKEGLLYGRGAIDDKGPAVAALFAVKCVMELGIPLKRVVRIIFGTDEENGSEDLKIYKSREELPEAVFTPDGSFPVINIEKGMMRSRFGGEIDGGSITELVGGKIPNAVSDSAYAVVEGIAEETVKNAISTQKSKAAFEVTAGEVSVTIRCTGKSAHASTPEGGINAVTALISLLNRLPLAEGKQRDILKGLEEIFPYGETDGEHMGLKCSDKESGALTCLFSVFKMDKSHCEGMVDVRFPVCTNLSWVEKNERAAFNKACCEFKGYMGDEPHIVSENSDFVKALLEVYEMVEGEKGHCIAIGGGTYVHNIDGGVAFGVERGDTDYHMHGADEFITVDELLRDTVLFAETIARICG